MNTSDATQEVSARAKKSPLTQIRLASLALFSVLLAMVGCAVWYVSQAPANLDLSTTRHTANGTYRVSYVPSSMPIPINQLHSWRLALTTADGQPVEGARITVDGDMPQHGHGLPTQPKVTHELGNGEYLVEGIKFQMGGWWVVDFEIDANGKQDEVRFNLVVSR